MLPIQTILHPTDFSPTSERALQLACALAHDYGARLVIFHAIVPPPIVYGEGILPPDPQVLWEEAEVKLERWTVPAADVRTERRLVRGEPVAETLRAAQAIPADLIVMGTRGRTGLARWLLGSVAEEVARKSTCPVLTASQPSPATGVERSSETPSACMPMGAAK